MVKLEIDAHAYMHTSSKVGMDVVFMVLCANSFTKTVFFFIISAGSTVGSILATLKTGVTGDCSLAPFFSKVASY